MNRLNLEKSPYLLQHAGNPVDWFPWGEEAFAAARERDCPLFLSIGYSTCHWCHVMERESFEDREVAALMNRAFVCVKVDREERPDVDELYMTACTMLTGSGGWPLTILMTPDRVPFFAATYLPRPTMLSLVPELEGVWRSRREEVERSARSVRAALEHSASQSSRAGLPGAELAERAFDELLRTFDEEHGGFGAAPKFPTPHILLFLLRHGRRSGDPRATAMVEKTLVSMARGGIWDHLGWGWHRYSTDERWLVPHFEKMLYDQALLAMACVEAWQVTGNAALADAARRTLAYVERDLLLPEGGFASAEDADSEGEEGRYYLWSVEELDAVVGAEGRAALERASAVAPAGNYVDHFGGGRRNILHLASPEAEIDEGLRAGLYAARERRQRPLRDDKVLADWNGLAIAAFARAARVFGEPRLASVAGRAAAFLLRALRSGDGGLLHRWRAGEAAIEGFATDYAFLAWALLELYEATLEPAWLAAALDLASQLVERFLERDASGAARLSLNSRSGEQLLVRPGSASDGALPSASSVAVLVLARLGRATGRGDLEEAARGIVRGLGDSPARHPGAHTFLLAALDFLRGPSLEVVVSGARGAPETEALLSVVRRGWHPATVLLYRSPDPTDPVANLVPFTKGMAAGAGAALAWVCRDRTCELPLADPADLARRLVP